MGRIVDCLSMKWKLGLLAGLFVVGFFILTALAYLTLQQVKVTGPVYQEIVQTKDLVADVLPPPAYLIESYLLVWQMLQEQDGAARGKLMERARQLRTEYETRHAFWQKTLPDGELKTWLTVTSYEPARDFLNIVMRSPSLAAVSTGFSTSWKG